MSEEISQETVEARAQFILEHTKLKLPSTLDALEMLSRPGVVFSDEQKEAIQERLKKEQE